MLQVATGQSPSVQYMQKSSNFVYALQLIYQTINLASVKGMVPPWPVLLLMKLSVTSSLIIRLYSYAPLTRSAALTLFGMQDYF